MDLGTRTWYKRLSRVQLSSSIYKGFQPQGASPPLGTNFPYDLQRLSGVTAADVPGRAEDQERLTKPGAVWPRCTGKIHVRAPLQVGQTVLAYPCWIPQRRTAFP